jgi:hypothetical protein
MADYYVLGFRTDGNEPDLFSTDDVGEAVHITDEARAGKYGEYDSVEMYTECPEHGGARADEQGCKYCVDAVSALDEFISEMEGWLADIGGEIH